MEFASEVVIKATLLCENIVQHRDPVSRARDRPLSVDAKLDWLFVAPALLAMLISLFVLLAFGEVRIYWSTR